jgi:hypothetical protein
MCDELLESRDGNKSTLVNVDARRAHHPLRVVQHAARGPRRNVIGFASLVQDVTERLNTERTIHYMAHHDALTGSQTAASCRTACTRRS